MNTTKVVRLTLLVVELAGTAIGNVLLFLFILRSRQLNRTPSLNFIFSCGAADLLSALVTIPFAMDNFVFNSGNLLGYAPTVAYVFSLTFSTILTLSATLIVLMDRILIVKYPVKYINKMTSKKARKAIIIMWVSVFLIAVLLTVARFWKRPPLPNEGPVMYLERLYKADGIPGACVPPAVITTAVIVPSAILYRQINKRRQALGGRNRSTRAAAGDKKITSSCRTVLAVMVVYLVSYFPVVTVNILHILHVKLYHDLKENKEFYAILFLQLSSFLNPLMFILRSSTIRRSAARVLTTADASQDQIELAIVTPRSVEENSPNNLTRN